MAERAETTIFGSQNSADQAALLFDRSFQPVPGGFAQTAPIESPISVNMDFFRDGIGQRNGSTEITSNGDLGAIAGWGAAEELIDIHEWRSPATNTRTDVAVSTLAIYIRTNGAWAVVKKSDNSTDYAHAATVSKCSFVEGDGHLFILLDGANQIQVFRNTILDDPLANGNTYNDAFGGGTNTITGSWTTGTYIGAFYQARLLYSKGDNVVEYTDTDQVWDRTGGSFFACRSNVVALKAFAPQYTDTLSSLIYSFCATTGVELRDAVTNAPAYVEGSGNAINHRCVVPINNWLMYVTDQKAVMLVNRNIIMNIGRRQRGIQGGDAGPLDNMDVDNARASSKAFLFPDLGNEQAQLFLPTASQAGNAEAVVFDMKFGEPTTAMSLPEAERLVRAAQWTIHAPGTNDWFQGVYQKQGAVIGFRSNGKTYTINNGKNDYDSLQVKSTWRTPLFMGGLKTNDKNWLLELFQFLPKGDWNVDISVFLDRSSNAEKTFSISQLRSTDAVYGTATYGTSVYLDTGVVPGADDLDLYSQAIQFELSNLSASEDWVLSNMDTRYVTVIEER